MFRRHTQITTTWLPPFRRGLCASSLSSTAIEETMLIKPYSPTPRHLTKFKLSLIDNHMPPCYMPFIFFYNNPTPGRTGSKLYRQRLDVLKSSLAHTLTRFYPLAGRLSNPDRDGGPDSIPVVHCNDEGVPFTFNTVSNGGESLDLFLINRGSEIVDSLQRFLPFPAHLITTPAGVESAPQIAIKATVFPCGGIAVGVCLLHKIVDTHTLVDFMKLWAATARENKRVGISLSAYAHDQAATWRLFPAHRGDVSPSIADVLCRGEGKKSVTRRFVFDEEAVSALKERAKSERVLDPTRSEAVGGLLWKCAMNAAAVASSPDGVQAGPIYSLAGMTVDLRYRMKEPWASGYTVGNLIWDPIALHNNDDYLQFHSSNNEAKTLQQLVHKLRSSIEKVDGEFMGRLEGGAGREEHMRNEEMRRKMMAAGAQSGSKVMHFVVSSVIRLGLYDVDFGWGNPVWVSMARFADNINNLVALMDSPTGYGVEAWIALHEQEMTLLEHDNEFLDYAKSTPNIHYNTYLSKLNQYSFK